MPTKVETNAGGSKHLSSDAASSVAPPDGQAPDAQGGLRLTPEAAALAGALLAGMDESREVPDGRPRSEAKRSAGTSETGTSSGAKKRGRPAKLAAVAGGAAPAAPTKLRPPDPYREKLAVGMERLRQRVNAARTIAKAAAELRELAYERPGAQGADLNALTSGELENLRAAALELENLAAAVLP